MIASTFLTVLLGCAGLAHSQIGETPFHTRKRPALTQASSQRDFIYRHGNLRGDYQHTHFLLDLNADPDADWRRIGYYW